MSLKTSCIRHPLNEPMVIYRQWQLKACDGNISSAIMLSFFEYWHNIKLEQRQQARKYNQIANKHGQDGRQLETLIQWHTNEEIENHTGLKRHSINKAISSLVELGFISTCKNPNPRFAFDTTKHFKFNAEAVNHWIENYISQNNKNTYPSVEICNRDTEFDRSPVEICNGPVEICNGPVEICKYPKIPIQDSSIENKQEKSDLPNGQPDRHISFFSDLEPDSEPPTENPPLLAKAEIKAEDQPISENQISETDQDLSVTSGKEDPPLPPPRRDECKTSTDEDLRFDKKIPFPGDIDSAPYCQELCFLKFELPDELALGTKQIIQSKRRVFGRQLLCLMNDQGVDPIANLSKFLKFYFDKNLSNNTHYKGKEYDDLVQSQTAQAIANKIKDSDHAVLVQTIAEFKKKIAKAAQPTLQPRSLEPLPERGDCVLPDMSSVFEANKKRLEEQIKRNKEKRIKTAANSKKDISTTSDPLLAAEAKLTQNPETFASDYDF